MLFFDTYAIIEIIKGSKAYQKYLNETPITTKFNLMELYFHFIKERDLQRAEQYYDLYLQSCVEISDEVIKEAMKFKFERKDKNLSYVDCICYVMALTLGIKLLTGDKEFKNMPNVEFVK